MRPDRKYVLELGNIKVSTNFGKRNSDDFAVEVVSIERNNKVEVLSALCLGKAKDWKKDNIDDYLSKYKDMSRETILYHALNWN